MSLDQIAAQLRQQLTATGQPARTTLERGLRLTLWRDGSDLVLSLTRPNVPPSEREVRICITVFSIPPDADREIDFQKGYHVIRLRWRDDASEHPKGCLKAEQPPLFPGDETFNHYTQEDR